MKQTRAPHIAAVVLTVLVTALGCSSKQNPKPPTQPGKSGASPHAPGAFVNVTAHAGIDFKLENGETGKYSLVSTTASGCAFLDYNVDGLLDILLVQAGPTPDHPASTPRPPCKLYQNMGGGTFKDVTESSGIGRLKQGYAIGAAVGDYDNDGYPDIYLSGCGGNHLLHNEKNGTFRDVTASAGVGDTDKGVRWATSSAWGDYDRDGNLDLLVGHYVKWDPKNEPKCSNSAKDRTYCSPEVYPVNEGPRLYHNEGNGKFTDTTEKMGLSKVRGRCLGVLWLDYDQDGWDDAYIACDISPNLLLQNRGGKRFEEVGLMVGVAYGADAAVLSGMGITAADYDQTGWESILVTNFSGQPNSLFHAVGKGAFEDKTYESGIGFASLNFNAFGVEFIDYDNDGLPDLVCGNGHVDPFIEKIAPNTTYKERKLLLRNTGNGAFVDQTADLGDLAEPRVTRGLAAGDFDNDGGIDILDNSQNMPAALYRNVGRAGRFVTLRLEGTKSNRDAAGALVWVTANGTRSLRTVRDGSSYASTSDRRLHFGLGEAQNAEAVEVRWPSGLRQRFTSLAGDRFYLLKEGSLPVPDPLVK